MKRTFSILLLSLLIAIASAATAEENVLQQGEYKILTYSLNNGEPVSYSESSSPGSINFHRLYIFPEAMDSVLNREEAFLSNPRINTDTDRLHGFVIGAAYSPLPDVTLFSSIGLTDTIDDGSIAYADRIGWEIDLGLAYKIFNNFAYEVHFGYMDTGELFTDSKNYSDVESITILANKLTMSF